MRSNPRVLIDASNLHGGGGVQVALSFLEELAALMHSEECTEMYPWLSSLNIETSSEIFRQMNAEAIDALACVERNRSWWHLFRSWSTSYRKRVDVSFVVFGPEYTRRRAHRRIVGFADGTSIYPPPLGAPSLPPLPRLRRRIRGLISRFLHTRADILIVETEDMKAQILRRLQLDADGIVVIPNTVNGVFQQSERWAALPHALPETIPQRLDSSQEERAWLICYITRAYPHKNLEFLADVQRELMAIGCHVKFVSTLSDNEWCNMSEAFRGTTLNVGQLTIEQVPTLYEACDAAIFPSLLEGFSAMPVEALSMGKLLFASDRTFVSETCRGAPVYFEPTDPKDCAKKIATVMRSKSLQQQHIARGLDVTDEMPTPTERAVRYLKVIQEQLALVVPSPSERELQSSDVEES